MTDMEDFVECVHDMIDEIRDKLDDMELNYPTIPEYVNPIINTDNFIDKLKMEGLSTPELEDFINSYLRWYND
ncbi:MAG: hypothetical protein IIT81_01745 [Mycoplasmataceae bacterium]|nr:hypothetical protein [Bacilli bacterium]MBQ5500917.1 hypothetical protein [Mycoplasmataceae bacterium]